MQKLQNKTSENSQKFFWSPRSTPIPTAHNGDIYALPDSRGKPYPFNNRVFYTGEYPQSEEKTDTQAPTPTPAP